MQLCQASIFWRLPVDQASMILAFASRCQKLVDSGADRTKKTLLFWHMLPYRGWPLLTAHDPGFTRGSVRNFFFDSLSFKLRLKKNFHSASNTKKRNLLINENPCSLVSARRRVQRFQEKMLLCVHYPAERQIAERLSIATEFKLQYRKVTLDRRSFRERRCQTPC